jgi:hypothetical protein
MTLVIFSALGVPWQVATAQGLCPESNVPNFVRGPSRAPVTGLVLSDLRSSGNALPEGPWSLSEPQGQGEDLIALEGVTITRRGGTHYDVAIDLRAWGHVITNLDLVVIDGDRRLAVGAVKGVELHCEAKRVAATISISERDLASFFGTGKAPTLRVERSAPDGC